MRLVLSGMLCAGMLVGATATLAADAPHFFYVVKDGNDVWFLNEVAGAKAEAEKLGAEFTSQNVELNANLAITGVDNAIAGGAKGIVIVVPEQQIGPAVLKKAKDAGIPMIAVDDGIVDDAGNSGAVCGFLVGGRGQTGRQRHRRHVQGVSAGPSLGRRRRS